MKLTELQQQIQDFAHKNKNLCCVWPCKPMEEQDTKEIRREDDNYRDALKLLDKTFSEEDIEKQSNIIENCIKRRIKEVNEVAEDFEKECLEELECLNKIKTGLIKVSKINI